MVLCVCVCSFVCSTFALSLVENPKKSQHTNVQCTMHYRTCTVYRMDNMCDEAKLMHCVTYIVTTN